VKQFLSDIRGVTFLELIIVVAIFALIFSAGTLVFGDIFGRNALRYGGHQLVQDLREARSSAISQKEDSPWGIYFDNSHLPHSYTLFKGADYNVRDSAFDRYFEFPRAVSFHVLSLNPTHTIVFEKSNGFPVKPGYVILQSEQREYSISVNSFGLVEYNY
jgi:prepilin-type N-terminal cleavage/methylation domain-containing protein